MAQAEREHAGVDARDRAVDEVAAALEDTTCGDARPSGGGGGSMRAAIIGVSVNATIIDTPIANAIVRPKL